jgi:sterol desaturase/sphingolipid hydroxylase (fatty acid hydroxylase superfamily)
MKLFYLLLAIFFVLGSLLEFWLTIQHDNKYYNKRDFINSLGLMLSGLGVDLLIKTLALYLLYQLSEYALLPMGYQWWVWCLCYVAWDFIFYIKHYLEHNVRFMWAIHVNHHSSPYMNLSTSLRSGVFKSTYRYFFWAILIGIGFPLPMFLVLYGWGKVWAFFGHSQKLGRWGILERFMVTPTHHLLHHSCNADHLNKNFGETFLIWDKLLGTFKETSTELTYGIQEPVNHDDFKDVVLHEFRSIGRDLRQATSFRQKLRILFGKPGSFTPQNDAPWSSSTAAG